LSPLRHGKSLTVLDEGRRSSSTGRVEFRDLLRGGDVLTRVEPNGTPIPPLRERSRDDVLLKEKRDVSDLWKRKREK